MTNWDIYILSDYLNVFSENSFLCLIHEARKGTFWVGNWNLTHKAAIECPREEGKKMEIEKEKGHSLLTWWKTRESLQLGINNGLPLALPPVFASLVMGAWIQYNSPRALRGIRNKCSNKPKFPRDQVIHTMHISQYQKARYEWLGLNNPCMHCKLYDWYGESWRNGVKE